MTTGQPSSTMLRLTSRAVTCVWHRKRWGRALQWSSIFAGTYSLMERPIDGLCNRPTHLNQLEGRQLQLYSSHRWPTNKDDLLEAGKDHHQCTRPSWGYNQRSSTSPRFARLNRDGQRLLVHLKVLVIALLLPWHKTQVIHRVLSSNWRTNKTPE